jgi:TfoX/Sxy family transcriptional regulator of competence genes
VAYDEELASRLRAVLAARPGIAEKKMFGGLSFMVAGQMCCGVLKDDLVVRVGPDGFDAALAQPHVRAFDFTGRPSTNTVYVARDGLVSAQALEAWVQRGVDFTAAHPRTAKRAALAPRQ